METMLATNLALNEKGKVIITWNSKDIVGFYTTDGTRIRTTVSSIDGYDAHRVNLTGNGVYMTSNATYYGYYPYSSDYLMNQNVMTALPVSYTDQLQSANDNLDHLAKYDYMVSQTTTTETEASFTFAHYGSVIRFACYVSTEMTFNSLEISSKTGEDLFTTEANMNLPNQTITSTSKSNKATLTLNNITVEAGDSLIAYMMLPPTNLNGKAMMLSLNTTDGSALQTYITGVNTQAGKVYPVSIGRENYFRTQRQTTPGEESDTEEILSLQLDIEDNGTTDTQITTATAYAPDFTTDANHKLKPFLLGDVNLDGTVDVTDAVLVINHYQARTTEELDFNIADVNGDDVIDVTDAVGIINIYQRR
jgi:hypothetical protein